MKQALPPRHLIPRWRRISATLKEPEAIPQGDSPKGSQEAAPEDLERAIADWKSSPTAGHLGDVLAFSVAPGFSSEVKEVARAALMMPAKITAPQLQFMRTLLDEKGEEEFKPELGNSICNHHVQRQVQEARSLLRVNPANPLVLLDLAQLQLASGKAGSAERSLLSALSLSRNNRIVLRTLARFYVHQGKPDKALALVARHPRTRVDPWLMASEIAISQAAATPSRFLSKGWKLARERSSPPADVAELAGAVGGVELSSGKVKQARELYRLALISPNDNVIAQAITDQKLLGIDLSLSLSQAVTRRAAEAQVLLAWRKLDTEAAERNALQWHAEEPFSSRPVEFLSSLFGVAGKYEEGVLIARRGLLSDPNDANLYTGLAYCLASLGQEHAAETAARKAVSLDGAKYEPHTVATRGLLAMRRGEFEVAGGLYESAFDAFVKRRETQAAAVCYAFYARSAYVYQHPRAKAILEKAVDLFKQAPTQDAAIVLLSVTETIGEPQGEFGLRRLRQWVYDEERNMLIQRDAVTSKGAPALVIKPKR